MYLDPELPNPFEIIVGTYEQYLLGYKVHNIVNVSKFRHTCIRLNAQFVSVIYHAVFLINF